MIHFPDTNFNIKLLDQTKIRQIDHCTVIEWGLPLYDFGVRVQDIDNPSVIKAKIKEIEETFDLIMIGKNKNKTDYHNMKFFG